MTQIFFAGYALVRERGVGGGVVVPGRAVVAIPGL